MTKSVSSCSTFRCVWWMVGASMLWVTTTTEAAPLEDLIDRLPDYGRPPTPQFSGYLDATAGCDTTNNGRYCKLHYWLALAEDDEQTSTKGKKSRTYDLKSNDFQDIEEYLRISEKPVVLWLNGGPGSSSILGFVQENGPLLINSTGGLMENPWSWTKVAHLVALEAPVGVGYSYCAKQTQGKACVNTDKFTASANRAAMQSFFTKFPELADNDFFVTGESYAGIYVPTLVKEILDHAPEIQMKGLAVGDPCTDNTAQADSMDALWYANKYGLVDEALYDLLWTSCQVRAPNLMPQGGKHLVASKLNRHLEEKRGTENWDEKKMHDYAVNMLDNLASHGGPRFHATPECIMAFRKFMLSSSHALSQVWSDLFIDDYSLFAPVTDQQDDDMAKYMSRPDVRQALHVLEAPVSAWPNADVGFIYTSEYDACNDDADEGALSMIDFYRNIAPRLKKTWIYNGDTDPCVSYEGTRTAVKRVGFPELDGGGYRPWFYNQTGASVQVLVEKAPLFGPGLLVQNLGAQLGGEVVNYENELSFLTFHGAGHMVPQFRPQAALHMLDRLVHFQDLSPLMPSNETLTNMDKATFDKTLNEWTEQAKGPPFVTNPPWDHENWEDMVLKVQ